MEIYTIAVCTLAENPHLNQCLESLMSVQKSHPCIVKIMLVVNKYEIGRGIQVPSGVKVVYEPLRGFSNVRNAAVLNVSADSNLIFIDDDEFVDSNWFESLKAAHEKFPEDALFGPVFSTSESTEASYRNRFKKQFMDMEDESLVKQASTANLLIPAKVLATGLVSFDPVFNLSSSEDTDLCFRLRNHGYKIRFVKNAVIYEDEKEDRFSKTYLDKRFIRDVSNYSYVLRKNSNFPQVLKRFSTLLLRVVFYSLASIFVSSYEVRKLAYTNSLRVLLTNKVQDHL